MELFVKLAGDGEMPRYGMNARKEKIWSGEEMRRYEGEWYAI
jgi:hypothetical protein